MSNTAAVIMIIVGLIINVSISRRRFYRRGPGGLQHYRRYSIGLITTIMEGVGRVIGVILLFGGLITLITNYSKKESKHTDVTHYEKVHHQRL